MNRRDRELFAAFSTADIGAVYRRLVENATSAEMDYIYMYYCLSRVIQSVLARYSVATGHTFPSLYVEIDFAPLGWTQELSDADYLREINQNPICLVFCKRQPLEHCAVATSRKITMEIMVSHDNQRPTRETARTIARVPLTLAEKICLIRDASDRQRIKQIFLIYRFMRRNHRLRLQ